MTQRKLRPSLRSEDCPSCGHPNEIYDHPDSEEVLIDRRSRERPTDPPPLGRDSVARCSKCETYFDLDSKQVIEPDPFPADYKGDSVCQEDAPAEECDPKATSTLSRFNRLKRQAQNQYWSELEDKGQERFGGLDNRLPSAALPGAALFPILDSYLEKLWKGIVTALNSKQIVLTPQIVDAIYRNLIEPELRIEIEHHMANYLNYRARQNLAPQAGRKHLEQLERIEERLIDGAQARVELRCDSLDQKDPAGLSDDLPDWLSGPPATGPNVTVRKWRDYLPVEMPTSENISWRQAEQSATGRSPEAEEAREKENESRRGQIHELNVKLPPDSQAGLESAKPAESTPMNAPSPDNLWGVLCLRVFRKSGEKWQVTYDDRDAYFGDILGLYYLKFLLERPQQSIPCATIENYAKKLTSTTPKETYLRKMGSEELDEKEALTFRKDLEFAQPALGDKTDIKALAQMREELKRITRELDRIPEDSPERRLLEKGKDDFLQHLKSNLGPGYNIRRFDGPSEKARKNVSRAITGAYHRIEKDFPLLVTFLRSTIKTGRECVYSPPTPTP